MHHFSSLLFRRAIASIASDSPRCSPYDHSPAYNPRRCRLIHILRSHPHSYSPGFVVIGILRTTGFFDPFYCIHYLRLLPLTPLPCFCSVSDLTNFIRYFHVVTSRRRSHDLGFLGSRSSSFIPFISLPTYLPYLHISISSPRLQMKRRRAVQPSCHYYLLYFLLPRYPYSIQVKVLYPRPSCELSLLVWLTVRWMDGRYGGTRG